MSGRVDADAGGRGARRTLLLIAAIVIAPVAASYGFYYLWPRDARTNYGELLPTQPLAAIDRIPALGALRGRWVIVVPAAGRCNDACRRMLYATRQARTIQGRDQERVARVLAITDDAQPEPPLGDEHPGLVVARAPMQVVGAWPRRDEAIYLVDPLGNQVLAWPVDPDVRALARDLTRLLRASRIG